MAVALCLLLASISARATVTAYTGPIPSDEVPSPYFNVEAGGVTLHVYQAQVRANNFTTFTSQFVNKTFDSNLGTKSPWTANLGIASFASFQLVGDNTVVITFPTGYPHQAITNASQIKILPAGAVDPSTITFTGDSIQFPVTGQTWAQQLTVEVNGDWLNSLHLFINPPDTPPTGGYSVPPGTISASTFSAHPSSLYIFGPGEYWISGNLNFPNGAELYLQDGAIIKWITPPSGQVNTHPMILLGTLHDSAQTTTVNANIHGWGILDGQASQQQAAGTTGNCGSDTSPLELNSLTTGSSTKVNVDGIVIRNSCTWNLPLWNVRGTASRPATINNVKILGFSGTNPNQAGSDGIDIVTSQYINVTHSFVRTDDDLIVVKQDENPAPYPTTNITVTSNILWNELAHALSIGAELYNAPNANQPSNPLAVDNVNFSNNTIIHDTGKCFLLGILSFYSGKVQNVTFSNITAEENRALIGIDLIPATGVTTNPSIIGSVQFSNVYAAAQRPVQSINGYILPMPNAQFLVALPYGNPYIGNGTDGGSEPISIQGGVTFSSVRTNNVPIASAMQGEDYYYLGSGNATGIPANVVEETVKLRNSADGSYTYYLDQIDGDMNPPVF